ncbi:MAG: DNA primase [Sedimentisphaerales bacterium]|nr:DNA primase [Sedimentisphaerales bacterium]
MAVRFDTTIIARVQQANDIVDVIGEHLSLIKKGKELVGICPFHADHRPSMYVNPTKQIFKCFACGAGGDVLKFVQMRENLSFSQSIERLAQRGGIKLEPVRSAVNKGVHDEEADPKALARVNDWAMRFWQSSLWNQQKGATARQYISQRQISDEMAKKWGLGLACDSWDDLLNTASAAKIPTRLLEQAGMIVAKEGGSFYDKFRNRLMFPIWDVTNRVIAFGGRTLGSDPAKYMNSPATALFDKSNSLYGLNFARHSIASSGTAVVVEGYTDCMMPHQFGCENVVATLGTSLTAGHARLLRRYANKIVLIFDSDVAGTEAANRALEIFLAERIDIRVASVPQGKDPCDFVLAMGKEGFEGVVNTAVDVMEYKWQRLLEGFEGSDTLMQRKAATEEFIKTAATAMAAGQIDMVTKGLMIGRLAAIMGLGNKEIEAELNKRAGRMGRGGGYVVPNQKVVSVELPQGFFAQAQREVIEVLLNEPKLFRLAGQKINAEQFELPKLKPIASALFKMLEKEGDFGLAAFLSRFESVEEGQHIVELAECGEKKGKFELRLTDALAAFEEHQRGLERQAAETIDDETEALRQYSAKLSKVNIRTTGI